MPSDLPLMLQTAYADLLDRARDDAFAESFPIGGTFVAKTLRNRRYWYFQTASPEGRTQKYVGPETPVLLERIESHRAERTNQRDRRGLVSMLLRSGGLPRPLPAIGDIVAALAASGVFRLRGVLVGTVAFQTYPGMLGVRLSGTAVQANDIDVAKFADVSLAIGEQRAPMLDVLRAADPSFRAVPHLHAPHAVTYAASNRLRVDFLSPNRGRQSEILYRLPAFGTDAQPLRFLDFLIHDPEPAVLLHGTGVLVSVPAPARFALHKLIVSRRRRDGDAKRDKDMAQARTLLEALVRRRLADLRAAWAEATGRGRTWQRLLAEGLAGMDARIRDKVLATVGNPTEPTES